MADCGDYWNGFVPWFRRSFSDCGSSRSSVSLHVGWNCRLFVSTPNVHIQLISYFGKNVMLSWRDDNMGTGVRNVPSLWYAPFTELIAKFDGHILQLPVGLIPLSASRLGG